jgi:Tfp pilus assembly PilM family ATPase
MKTSVPHPFWLSATPPTTAIEIASRRVTVVEVTAVGAGTGVARHASEALPPGAVEPALTGVNVRQSDVVADALGRALEAAGLAATRRAALVVPDSIARVSLVTLAELPSRPADLDQVIRWQIRKSTPFPMETAALSHFVAARDGEGATMATIVARTDVVTQYEAILRAFGIHPGIVDLAGLNVMNAVMGSDVVPEGDWLLVHLSGEATTLAILRGSSLLFYRHRTAVDDESLGSLVHQTAMYHEDRLGGGTFSRVWISGDGAIQARHEINQRLGLQASMVDIRGAMGLGGGFEASQELLDALAAPVGVLLRERRAA